MKLTEALLSANMPEEFTRSYEKAGVIELFPWQSELIQILQRKSFSRNLLYSAPTGGGKTLVAELLMLRQVVLCKKKAIFVLPFVSIVHEKVRHFNAIVRSFNRTKDEKSDRIKVKGLYGEMGVLDKNVWRADIIICTVDKAASLINLFIERVRLDRVGIVVVDELHTVGGSFQGYSIENMLTKLRYIATGRDKCSVSSSGDAQCIVQLVALSGTVSNLHTLGRWLEAEVYKTTERPVPLAEYIVSADTRIVYKAGTQNQQRKLAHVASEYMPVPTEQSLQPGQQRQRQVVMTSATLNPIDYSLLCLCIEALRKQQQLLVFCSSRKACELKCEMVARCYEAYFSQQPLTQEMERKKDARKNLLATLSNNTTEWAGHVVNDRILSESIISGVAFHHAGLTSVERGAVESGFRAGDLSVVVATSTLATGVNLPADVVVITSRFQGNTSIDTVQYRQMVGRAGRPGGGKKSASSYLLVRETKQNSVPPSTGGNKSIASSCAGTSFESADNLAVGAGAAVDAPSGVREAAALATAELPPVMSQLRPQCNHSNGLIRIIIEAIGLHLCRNASDIERFISMTLMHCTASCDENRKSVETCMEDAFGCLNYLYHCRVIQSTFTHRSFLASVLRAQQASTAGVAPGPESNCCSGRGDARESGIAIPLFSPEKAANSASFDARGTGESRGAHQTMPLQQQQSLLNQVTLELTRFGGAMLKGNFRSDETMLLYDHLLRAYERGIQLSSPLHLLYLTAPLDHSLRPDFTVLFNLMDNYTTNRGGLSAFELDLARVAELAGVEIAILVKWRVHAPGQGQLNACYTRLRDLTLRAPSGRPVVAVEATRQGSDSVPIHAVIPGEGSALSASEPKVEPQKNPHPLKQQRYREERKRDTQKPREETLDGLTASEWRTLGVVKRLWAAHLLRVLSNGSYDVHRVASIFKCSAGQVVDLRNKAHMTAIRVMKFAAEMGWSNLEHPIAELRTSLRADMNPKVTSLLEGCPGMTEKIAKAFVSHGIETPLDFLQSPPLALAQMLQLSSCFEMPLSLKENADMTIAEVNSVVCEADQGEDEQLKRQISDDENRMLNLYRGVSHLLDRCRSHHKELEQDGEDEEEEEIGQEGEEEQAHGRPPLHTTPDKDKTTAGPRAFQSPSPTISRGSAINTASHSGSQRSDPDEGSESQHHDSFVESDVEERSAYRDEYGVMVAGAERSTLEDRHKAEQTAMLLGMSPAKASLRERLAEAAGEEMDEGAENVAVSQLASAVKKQVGTITAPGIASTVAVAASATASVLTDVSVEKESLSDAINDVLLKYGRFPDPSRSDDRKTTAPSSVESSAGPDGDTGNQASTLYDSSMGYVPRWRDEGVPGGGVRLRTFRFRPYSGDLDTADQQRLHRSSVDVVPPQHLHPEAHPRGVYTSQSNESKSEDQCSGGNSSLGAGPPLHNLFAAPQPAADPGFAAPQPASDPGFIFCDTRRSLRHSLSLYKLAREARCVSIELLYRRLPRHLYHFAPTDDHRSPESYLAQWGDLLSWSCPLARRETSTLPNGGCEVLNLLASSANTGTSENYWEGGYSFMTCVGKCQHNDPHVLVGCAMNFGGDRGYYLPLPLPLPRAPPSFASKEAADAQSSSLLLALHHRPMQLVMAFVGFGGFLNKAKGLARLMRTGKSEDNGNCSSLPSHEEAEVGGSTQDKSNLLNPLFSACRASVHAARECFWAEWAGDSEQGLAQNPTPPFARRDICDEWTLLRGLVSDPHVTKVGIDVKAQLVCLLERGIAPAGAVEDPQITATLLCSAMRPSNVAACGEPTEKRIEGVDDEKKIKLVGSVEALARVHIPCLDYTDPRVREVHPGGHYVNIQRRTAFIAIAAMRAAASLLTRLESLGLDMNREFQYLQDGADTAPGQGAGAEQRKGLRPKGQQQGPHNSLGSGTGDGASTSSRHREGAGHCEKEGEGRAPTSLGLLHSIEMACLLPLAQTEYHGVTLDIKWYQRQLDALRSRQRLLEWYFVNAAGPHFQICSAVDVQQLRGSIREDRKRCIEELAIAGQGKDGCCRLPPKFTVLLSPEALEAATEKHPLVLLLGEYRRNNHAVLMIEAILRHMRQTLRLQHGMSVSGGTWVRKVPACRPAITTIGTETGRVTVVNPGLQTLGTRLSYVPLQPETHPPHNLGPHPVEMALLNKYYYVDRQLQRRCYWPREQSMATGADSGGGEVQCLHDDVAAATVTINPRQGLTAKPGFVLMSLDFQQAELRLIGGYSSDPALVTAFQRSWQSELRQREKEKEMQRTAAQTRSSTINSPPTGGFSAIRRALQASPPSAEKQEERREVTAESDVFIIMATEWYGLPYSSITAAQRSLMKHLLYAAMYGAGSRELSRILARDAKVGKSNCNLATDELWKVREDLRTSYDFCRKKLAGVGIFQTALRRKCRALRRAVTPMGRVRWLPDLALSTDSERYRRATRQALNTFIQASMADLLKVTIVNIHSCLEQMALGGYAYRVTDKSTCSGSELQQKQKEADHSLFSYNVPYSTLADMHRCLKLGQKVDADAVLVLSLHDELVYEVREECLPVVAHIARLCFEKSVVVGAGRVPMQATIRVGANFASLADYRPT